ncbi:cytochrome P450 306a1 [Orussus abietinus]|uniref:cytochrome P450 306a1 n=1 Tax=Orussus abietinus TaxID=222816 RepID=UPI000625CB0A|nr:cytochrome P450 306a1 [Orussus abietinus]
MVFAYLALGLAILVLFFLNRYKRTLHLPPGPWGLPVLGYLPWIDPKAPHESLTALSRKYGPICGLKMGSVYTVLLAEPRLIRQVLAKDAFSGRAPLYLTHGIMQGYGLICAEGKLWREQRRFVTSCLKNFGMVKLGPKRDKMEEKILEAVSEAIVKLRERSGDTGVDPFCTLHHCVGNLMNKLVFGKVYDEEDGVWRWLQHLQEEGVKHIGVSGPLNFLPFLRFLPYFGRTMESLVDGKLKTHEIYKRMIQEHQKNPIEEDNFLAAFAREMQARHEIGDPGSFTEPQYLHLLADLFGAGTDTSLTTIRWILLFVAAYPQEQDKVQEEMDSVLSGKDLTLEDRSQLPRLEATIAEAQRLRSVVPLGIPHGTIEDTKIDEYDIPKGTMVVPLQWAIHMDPRIWPDPVEFRPQRFLAEDGSLSKPEAFLPFQSGKRMCVGDELARMLLFLFAGKILQSFKVRLAPGSTIDLEGEGGITLVPKPHRLVFAPRPSA